MANIVGKAPDASKVVSNVSRGKAADFGVANVYQMASDPTPKEQETEPGESKTKKKNPLCYRSDK